MPCAAILGLLYSCEAPWCGNVGNANGKELIIHFLLAQGAVAAS